MHFEKLLNWYGRKQFIPDYIEDNIVNFFLSRDVQPIETSGANNSQQSGNEYGTAARS